MTCFGALTYHPELSITPAGGFDAYPGQRQMLARWDGVFGVNTTTQDWLHDLLRRPGLLHRRARHPGRDRRGLADLADPVDADAGERAGVPAGRRLALDRRHLERDARPERRRRVRPECACPPPGSRTSGPRRWSRRPTICSSAGRPRSRRPWRAGCPERTMRHVQPARRDHRPRRADRPAHRERAVRARCRGTGPVRARQRVLVAVLAGADARPPRVVPAAGRRPARFRRHRAATGRRDPGRAATTRTMSRRSSTRCRSARCTSSAGAWAAAWCCRLLRDRPAVARTVTLVAPVSPYGYGGTRDVAGTFVGPDGACSGGGGGNPDFVGGCWPKATGRRTRRCRRARCCCRST